MSQHVHVYCTISTTQNGTKCQKLALQPNLLPTLPLPTAFIIPAGPGLISPCHSSLITGPTGTLGTLDYNRVPAFQLVREEKIVKIQERKKIFCQK